MTNANQYFGTRPSIEYIAIRHGSHDPSRSRSSRFLSTKVAALTFAYTAAVAVVLKTAATNNTIATILLIVGYALLFLLHSTALFNVVSNAAAWGYRGHRWTKVLACAIFSTGAVSAIVLSGLAIRLQVEFRDFASLIWMVALLLDLMRRLGDEGRSAELSTCPDLV